VISAYILFQPSPVEHLNSVKKLRRKVVKLPFRSIPTVDLVKVNKFIATTEKINRIIDKRIPIFAKSGRVDTKV